MGDRPAMVLTPRAGFLVGVSVSSSSVNAIPLCTGGFSGLSLLLTNSAVSEYAPWARLVSAPITRSTKPKSMPSSVNLTLPLAVADSEMSKLVMLAAYRTVRPVNSRSVVGAAYAMVGSPPSGVPSIRSIPIIPRL
jgi:hypothetical protein